MCRTVHTVRQHRPVVVFDQFRVESSQLSGVDDSLAVAVNVFLDRLLALLDEEKGATIQFGWNAFHFRTLLVRVKLLQCSGYLIPVRITHVLPSFPFLFNHSCSADTTARMGNLPASGKWKASHVTTIGEAM